MKNYQPIIGKENKRIKILEKLKTKKYRQEYGQFVVENLTIIMDAMKAGYSFESLFVTEEFVKKNRDKLAYLEKFNQSKNFYLVDPRVNKQYSNLDTPSGISAVYGIVNREPDASSVIYLNNISDPGNLGTIMRTALAFGFVNLVMDDNCVDAYNPKVVSAAKDAIFKLNIAEDKPFDWIADIKLPIYATSSHTGTSLSAFRPAKAFCLVLGSESHGVSPEIMKKAKKTIKIDIVSDIESLNVATAAAILLYELKRK